MFKVLRSFKISKHVKHIILLTAILLLISIFSADFIIKKDSRNFLYSDLNSVPENNVGILLGTRKTLKNGNENLYYKYRIEATVELYKANKIKFIIISGDNSEKNYNEPLDMKTDLISNGIPDSAIYLDFAGFRTFDSKIRARDVFGQSKFTIISQEFHNQRAVYLARCEKIEAVAYNAKNVEKFYGLKTQIREYFARLKLFIDLVTNKKPKFLGEKITIGKSSTKQ